MAQDIQRVGYGLSEALPVLAPRPIKARRAPTSADKGYSIGQMWVYSAANAVYVLTSVVGNVATWESLSGGAGVFSSLTVTPGPISLTGTTSINTSGSAVTTIGTGGTGAVNIGNATGDTSVTGDLSVSAQLGSATLVVTGDGQIGGASGSLVTLGNTGTTTTVDISAGSGGINLAGKTTSTGDIDARTFHATGDGGGVASSTGLTNVTVAVAGGTGVFVINPSTGAGNTANTGFLKLYVGATPIFVPYWTQTT